MVAFCQPWGGGEHNYIKPPFAQAALVIAQAALVIAKVAAENASAVLVLPVWPALPWWQRILNIAAAAVILPTSASLFTHGRGMRQGFSPRWQTAALYVERWTTPTTVCAGALRRMWESWPPLARRARAPPPRG